MQEVRRGIPVTTQRRYMPSWGDLIIGSMCIKMSQKKQRIKVDGKDILRIYVCMCHYVPAHVSSSYPMLALIR